MCRSSVEKIRDYVENFRENDLPKTRSKHFNKNYIVN